MAGKDDDDFPPCLYVAFVCIITAMAVAAIIGSYYQHQRTQDRLDRLEQQTEQRKD